ncbi:MAG: AEC family transporter [Lentisphaerae bacterium]|nr:AEC family transporter [Lentisphaerota bacterium]
MTSVVTLAILEIFTLFALGALARRLGYLQDADLSRWSRLGVDFLLPGLAFHTITQNLDPVRLRAMWIAPLIAVGMFGVGALVGEFTRPRHAPYSDPFSRTFRHLCAMNNYSYLPIVIIQRLWGGPALADFFIFNLGSEIGFWTLGVALFGQRNHRAALRQILSPNVIAILLAVTLCLLGWHVRIPRLVTDVSAWLGAGAIPLLVLLVGGSMYPPPRLRHKAALARIAVLRLALIPAINIAILHALPLEPGLRRIAFVVALMPSAVMSVILARQYDGDPEFAAETAVVTTVLSILTVPLALGWLL